MAKRNHFSYEKRQREIKKRKKKEAKAERKRILKAIEAGEMSPDDLPPDPDAPEVVDADTIPGMERSALAGESGTEESPAAEERPEGSSDAG